VSKIGPVRFGSLHLHRTAADMGCQDVARPTNGREGSLATRPFRSWPAGIPRRTPLPLVSPGASWRRMELRPSILDELTVFSDYITRLFDLYCNFQILYYVLLTFFYGDALEGVSCRWKSICDGCQASRGSAMKRFGDHRRSSLSRVLASTTIFRITAVMATFLSFPASTRRS